MMETLCIDGLILVTMIMIVSINGNDDGDDGRFWVALIS